MLNEDRPELRVFNSRLEFALNRFNEVNRSHLENGARLRKSSNFAERMIGYVGPVSHMLLASILAPLAIAVAMEDSRYSKEKGGYYSNSHQEWLDEIDKRNEEKK
ncbi:MAG: hypothetical protein WC584_00715 [Candidatus Pacearchaeota archaeon]